MAKEIERKFLVVGDSWRSLGIYELYRQGYLSTVAERTVRVRIIGSMAFLTIKGLTEGVSRLEFEYPIPLADAQLMLDNLCERPLIEKIRYKIAFGQHIWEIDEYHGDNQGLIVAEIELQDETEKFELPEWIGAEVSDDPRYYNANLVAYPFTRW